LQSFTGGGAEDTFQKQFQIQLDGLAKSILYRRLKNLYSHLSSGVRARANGALALLAAIATRNRLLCADTLQVSNSRPLLTAPYYLEGQEGFRRGSGGGREGVGRGSGAPVLPPTCRGGDRGL
jgi:hypothetical protein